jgi:L-lactate utilization protein LutB
MTQLHRAAVDTSLPAEEATAVGTSLGSGMQRLDIERIVHGLGDVILDTPMSTNKVSQPIAQYVEEQTVPRAWEDVDSKQRRQIHVMPGNSRSRNRCRSVLVTQC